MGQGTTPPADIDTTVPSVARIYDYLLGGKNNYTVDREAAERALTVMPQMRRAARENRNFLIRVVRFLTADVGIRQFIDLGSGLPTQANVHEVAQSVAPDARVVYVDHDPIVTAHARALLSAPNTTAILANARRPDDILEHSETQALIDFNRPIAVLFLSVLHFVPDNTECERIVTRFREAIPSGSYMALSHGSQDSRPAEMEQVVDLYNNERIASARDRTREEILRFFNGFELVEPGLTFVTHWHAQIPESRKLSVLELVLGGVGRKT